MGVLVRYWSIIIGITSMLVIALRISFQLGGINRAFKEHIKASHEAHTSIWKQLDWLRDRRR